MLPAPGIHSVKDGAELKDNKNWERYGPTCRSRKIYTKELAVPMRPRILIVGPTPPPYHGGSVFTMFVLAQLPQEDFVLVHLDISDRRGLQGIGRVDFTNVYLAILHGLQFLWLLLRHRPAIIYVQLSQALTPFLRDCLFIIPAILLHRKIVVHLHGSIFRSVYETWPKWAKALTRYALGHVSRVVVLCERLREVFFGLVPEEKIIAIPNGINLSAAQRLETKAKDKNTSVLYIGALREEKGILDILRAIPNVIKTYPETQFIFAGEWQGQVIEDQAKGLIDQFDLGRNVIFYAPVAGKAKEQLFQEASMLLLPSYNEGQPFVILEAMASGLPVIGTDVGCVAETIGDGIGGFLIEKTNPQQLSQKIVFLIQETATRERMGEQARQRILNNYTFDATAERLRHVFCDVLGKE